MNSEKSNSEKSNAEKSNIDIAKTMLLYDAASSGGNIILLLDDNGGTLRGYDPSDDSLSTYVEALHALEQEGYIDSVFKNHEMQLFTVSADAPFVHTLQTAKERILQELESGKNVYKIHSTDGEYIQCGNDTFVSPDALRIIFLRAAGDLLHGGKIIVKHEGREMCTMSASASSERADASQNIEFLNPDAPLENCA